MLNLGFTIEIRPGDSTWWKWTCSNDMQRYICESGAFLPAAQLQFWVHFVQSITEGPSHPGEGSTPPP